MTAINIGSPASTVSGGEERHKAAERVAVFMGKRVEKASLSLICHKGGFMAACDVRTLFWPCIDSSRVDRLGAGSQTPCGRRESIRDVHSSGGGAPGSKTHCGPIPLLFLQTKSEKKNEK